MTWGVLLFERVKQKLFLINTCIIAFIFSIEHVAKFISAATVCFSFTETSFSIESISEEHSSAETNSEHRILNLFILKQPLCSSLLSMYSQVLDHFLGE